LTGYDVHTKFISSPAGSKVIKGGKKYLHDSLEIRKVMKQVKLVAFKNPKLRIVEPKFFLHDEIVKSMC
jgi:hypothetical protein